MTAAILGAAFAAASRYGRPFEDFTRDPVLVASEGSCTGAECTILGFVSSLSGLLWAAAAAVCLFAAMALHLARGRGVLRSPYLWLGFLTTVLALDDEFMLHETPHETLTWLNESTLTLAYTAAGLTILYTFRGFFLRTSFWILGAAVGVLAASVGLDLLLPNHFVLEDGAKLLGIALWVTYLGGTGAVDVATALTTTPRTEVASLDDVTPSTPPVDELLPAGSAT